MTQQYLTVNGKTFHDSLRKPHIIKTYSFTTDEDDAATESVTISFQTVSNHDKLMSTNSPSIDSYNNDEDSSENSKKPQKRKSKRQNELDNHTEKKPPVRPKPSWYKIIDLWRLLTVIIVIAIVYVMWIKRDVWINRLLTSDARMRRYGVVNDNQIENSSIFSTSDSSPQEDIIENGEEKNNVDEELTSEKVKSRTRKTKQNIINEIRKKKHRHSSNVSSTKKKPQQQQRSLMTRQSTPIHILTYDDVLDQVRTHLKSQRRQRDFFSKLSKATGLRKDQLQRFLYKKNYQIITLQTFVTLLDSFNLMLVIVPK